MNGTNTPPPPVKPRDMTAEMMQDLDAEIEVAMYHQKSLLKDIEILKAKCEVAGEYRIRIMDLRDRFRGKLSINAKTPTP